MSPDTKVRKQVKSIFSKIRVNETMLELDPVWQQKKQGVVNICHDHSDTNHSGTD